MTVSLEMVRTYTGTFGICFDSTLVPPSSSSKLNPFFRNRKVLVIAKTLSPSNGTKTFAWLFQEGWKKLFALSQSLNMKRPLVEAPYKQRSEDTALKK